MKHFEIILISYFNFHLEKLVLHVFCCPKKSKNQPQINMKHIVEEKPAENLNNTEFFPFVSTPQLQCM